MNSHHYPIAKVFVHRLFGVFLPTVLALVNAAFWYWPKRDTIMGWGDDPHFNLWVHEHNWAAFSKLGPFAALRSEFWNSNIYYPEPLTIALSDNYSASALLSWPFRLVLHNGAQAMSLLCVCGNVAAFLCMAAWLRRLGVRRLAFWGGLAFSACGWVQTQSAHFQNACIFVFPLALWMWSRFRANMNVWRLLGCALAFGWIIGWNLYFLTFANVILVCLAAATVLRHRWQWKPIAVLLVATLLVEYPIARQYLKLQSMMGDYAVGIDDFRYFSARLSSPFFHFFHRTWLQAHFDGLYPKLQDVTIESAGFIGYTWLILWIRTLFGRRAVRFWAWAGLISFFVALGPDYYVFDLFEHFPGMSSLRAIGRAQAVSTFFSLTAIVMFLEGHLAAGKARVCWALLPLGLLAAEQVPGRDRDFVTIRTEPWVNPVTAQKLTEQHVPAVLVLPEPDSHFQLYYVHVPVAHYSGYSGRAPVQAGLVYQNVNRISTPEQAQRVFDFVQPPLVGTNNSHWQDLLARTPGFDSLGCSPGEFGPMCLFRPTADTQNHWKAIPRLRLDRDTTWKYVTVSGRVTGELHANRTCMLDLSKVGRCHLEECAKYPRLPEICKSQRLDSGQFSNVFFQSGQSVLGWNSTRNIFDSPDWFRPNLRFKIVCPAD